MKRNRFGVTRQHLILLPMKKHSTVSSASRRNFIKRSTAFGALTVLPGHFVFGQNASTGELPPSEMLNVAVVGAGNQGGKNVHSLLATGHCRIVALCDVDLKGAHVRETLERCPEAKLFTDFRKMFDVMADDIDAVLVATPDHSHFCATMLAMSLGKPVYVQKPLAHTFGQCERLIALAEKSGVVTQMGNQGHSGANYFQFKAWMEAGIIRDVTRITAHMNNPRRWHGWGASVTGYATEAMPEGLAWDQWCDQAPVNPFSRRLHPQEWRSWYDYGSGAFGDWGPHILDTCHRFLKLGLPEKVVAMHREGVNELVFPQESTIRFDFPEREGMPPCVVTWYDGVNNRPEIEKEYCDPVTDEATGKTEHRARKVGKPGKVVYAKDLVFQGGSHADVLRIIPREKFKEMYHRLPKFPTKQTNHFANFLFACKGEEEARSPFAVSGPLTQVFNIGVIAQRLGGEIHFDRETKRITNNQLANALLDPPPRKGWEEFYQL